MPHFCESAGCCCCPQSIESHKFKLAETINKLLMVSWNFTAFSWECESADTWTVTNDGWEDERERDCSGKKKRKTSLQKQKILAQTVLSGRGGGACYSSTGLNHCRTMQVPQSSYIRALGFIQLGVKRLPFWFEMHVWLRTSRPLFPPPCRHESTLRTAATFTNFHDGEKNLFPPPFFF